MTILVKKDTPEVALRMLAAELVNKGVRVTKVDIAEHILLTLVGDTYLLDTEHYKALPYVEDVRRITPSYRLTARAAHPEPTVIEVGQALIGADFCLMAGPCAVESAVQLGTVARSVKASGAQILRGGIFKPRTSPYTFPGLGEAGMELLLQAKKETGLPVITELTDLSQLPFFEQVDIIQVGMRNMQNYEVLRQLGQMDKPILLKRGQAATIDELLLAAEYILRGGNGKVILCERGIRTFSQEMRATLDLSAVPVLKKATHLPVVVDPSHAAGSSEWVAPLALAAVAVGADGLLVEVHDRPAVALSDGAQALNCEQFDELAQRVRAMLPYAWTEQG